MFSQLPGQADDELEVLGFELPPIDICLVPFAIDFLDNYWR